MENIIVKTAQQYSKNWWISLIVGVLGIAMGIWCINTPDGTLVALTITFVSLFFLTGIMDIFLALSNTNTKGWGWTLVGGIIDILFGVLLVSLPAPMITAMLIYYVGFWIMFRSIWAIGMSFELKKIGGGSYLMVIGILGLLFSFLYLISPVFTNGSVLVFFVSVSFITYGIFRIVLAFNLRTINKNLKNLD